MMTRMVEQPFEISHSLKPVEMLLLALQRQHSGTGKSLGDRLRRELGAATARP